MNILLHETLQGKKTRRPPFWFMRQAGRYLPEYRELRKKAGGFLEMCYNPQMAAEVTIQPIRRFDMDAAIVFSDILVVPHAMGQNVWFEQGEGPRLDVLRDRNSIDALTTQIEARLNTIGDTLRLTRSQLPKHTSLIGFCGAPWTVACYMVEGKTKRDYEEARNFAIREKESFDILIDKLTEASFRYLCLQAEAGADVLQIFDSWAGVVSEREYMLYVAEPTKKLVQKLKAKYPHVPVIGFPRGIGTKLPHYETYTGVDATGIDTQSSFRWATHTMKKTIQGNLDPLVLAEDKNILLQEVKNILAWGAEKPFIFNLGHGIVKTTPIEHVELVCDLIRNPQ